MANHAPKADHSAARPIRVTRGFDELLWDDSRLITPHCRSTRTMHSALAAGATRRLAEVLAVPCSLRHRRRSTTLSGVARAMSPRGFKTPLAGHRFTIERSAAYGVQPGSSRLLDAGLWFRVASVQTLSAGTAASLCNSTPVFTNHSSGTTARAARGALLGRRCAGTCTRFSLPHRAHFIQVVD